MVSNEVRVDLIGADMVGVQNLLMLQRVVLFYVKKVKNDGHHFSGAREGLPSNFNIIYSYLRK